MLHPGDFSVENACSQACKPIVSAAFVVKFVVWPFSSLFNQSSPQHPLNRSVQRAWAHTQGTLSHGLDFAHDRIAMLVPRCQGQQNVQLRNRDGRLVPADWIGHGQCGMLPSWTSLIISATDIVCQHSSPRGASTQRHTLTPACRELRHTQASAALTAPAPPDARPTGNHQCKSLCAGGGPSRSLHTPA